MILAENIVQIQKSKEMKGVCPYASTALDTPAAKKLNYDLSKEYSPKTGKVKKPKVCVPNASTVKSPMDVMLCIQPNLAFVIGPLS